MVTARNTSVVYFLLTFRLATRYQLSSFGLPTRWVLLLQHTQSHWTVKTHIDANLVNKGFAIAEHILKDSLQHNAHGLTVLDLTVAPYSEFDPITNRLIWNGSQLVSNEVATTLMGLNCGGVYFDGSLTNLCRLKVSWTTDWGSCTTRSTLFRGMFYLLLVQQQGHIRK